MLFRSHNIDFLPPATVLSSVASCIFCVNCKVKCYLKKKRIAVSLADNHSPFSLSFQLMMNLVSRPIWKGAFGYGCLYSSVTGRTHLSFNQPSITTSPHVSSAVESVQSDKSGESGPALRSAQIPSYRLLELYTGSELTSIPRLR